MEKVFLDESQDLLTFQVNFLEDPKTKLDILQTAEWCRITFEHLEAFTDRLDIENLIPRGLKHIYKSEMQILDFDLESPQPLTVGLKDFMSKYEIVIGEEFDDSAYDHIESVMNIIYLSLVETMRELQTNESDRKFIKLLTIIKQMYIVVHIYWNVLAVMVDLTFVDSRNNYTSRHKELMTHLNKLVDLGSDPYMPNPFTLFLEKYIGLRDVFDMV